MTPAPKHTPLSLQERIDFLSNALKASPIEAKSASSCYLADIISIYSERHEASSEAFKEAAKRLRCHDALIEALKEARFYVAADAMGNKIEKVREQAEKDLCLINAALAAVDGE